MRGRDPLQRLLETLAVLVLLVVGVWPVADLLWESTQSDDGFSLQRYADLLGSPRQAALLAKTVALAAGATAGSLLLAAPFAFIVARCAIPLRRPLALAGFVPFILSPHVQVMTWVQCWTALGGDLHGEAGVMVTQALSYFPLAYLILFCGLRSVDPAQEEAAWLARGLSPALRGVILPAVAPYAATAAILVFLFAVSNFGVPGLLRVQVLAVDVLFRLVSSHDTRQATATAAPFLLLGLAGVTAQWLLEARTRQRGLAGFAAAPRVYDVGRLRWPALAFAAGVIAVTLVIPLLVLLATAGSAAVFATALQKGQADLLNSLFLAAAAATVTTLVGSLVACRATASGSTAGRALDYLALVPFALPPSLLGVKLILMWNQAVVTQFLAAAVAVSVLAFFCRFVTFPVKIVAARLRQVDPALEEAGALAALPWWQRQRLLLSLGSSALATSWLAVFVLVSGELSINLLIDPPGFNTLGTRIFNLFHYGRLDLLAALSLEATALMAVPFALYFLVFQRRGWRAL